MLVDIALWGGLVGGLVLAALLGGVLHEAAHAAVAVALGGVVVDAGREGWGLYVDWRPPASGDVWTVRLVQLAPAVTGWGLLAVWVLLYGWPSMSLWAIGGGVCWAVYTLGGGLEDYSRARAVQG